MGEQKSAVFNNNSKKNRIDLEWSKHSIKLYHGIVFNVRCCYIFVVHALVSLRTMDAIGSNDKLLIMTAFRRSLCRCTVLITLYSIVISIDMFLVQFVICNWSKNHRDGGRQFILSLRTQAFLLHMICSHIEFTVHCKSVQHFIMPPILNRSILHFYEREHKLDNFPLVILCVFVCLSKCVD